MIRGTLKAEATFSILRSENTSWVVEVPISMPTLNIFSAKFFHLQSNNSAYRKQKSLKYKNAHKILQYILYLKLHCFRFSYYPIVKALSESECNVHPFFSLIKLDGFF